MGLKDWIRVSRQHYADHSIFKATKLSVGELAVGGLRRVVEHAPTTYGTPIWSQEFDVLVILDACRYDTFAELYGDTYGVRRHISQGSTSKEWIRNVFNNDYAAKLQNTAYVTGNPYSARACLQKEPHILREVWRTDWDSEIGTIHPEPITDVAIQVQRQYEPSNLIIHYMQPHYPSLPNKLGKGIVVEIKKEDDEDAFLPGMVRRGEVSRAEAKRAYQANLRYIMNHIEDVLLNNIEGKVVLTSDHGEMFGEWGQYGHEEYIPLPQVRTVPWASVRTTDTTQYIPGRQAVENVDETVESRLESLGYVVDE